MIEFIRDVPLGDGVVIKKGMVAVVNAAANFHTLAGSVFMPTRIVIQTWRNFDWRKDLKLSPGEAAIYDFDESRFPRDSYKEIPCSN